MYVFICILYLNNYVYIKILLCLHYMYLFIQMNMCILICLKLLESNVHCNANVFRDINEDEWL